MPMPCLARLGEYRPCRLAGVPHPGIDLRPPRRRRRRGLPHRGYSGDNDARTLAFGAESSLRFDFPVACKTGTSSDFRDNWAFGYTPEFTVGVWVGNVDNSPMQHISGVTGAAPVLHELFAYLHQHHGTTWFAQPADVVECWIDPITGKRLKDSAPTTDAIQEKFIATNLPPLESPEDYEIRPATRAVRLGSEYRAWLASGDNWLGGRAVLAEDTSPLKILFPPPGTTLYLDADLPGQGRRMTLNAAGPKGVEWHSATLSLATEGQRKIALLTEGRHELEVRDPVSGGVARTWIQVLER